MKILCFVGVGDAAYREIVKCARQYLPFASIRRHRQQRVRNFIDIRPRQRGGDWAFTDAEIDAVAAFMQSHGLEVSGTRDVWAGPNRNYCYRQGINYLAFLYTPKGAK